MSDTTLDAMQKALKVARIYFQKNAKSPEADAFVNERGLSIEAVWRFELGYSPNQWRGLVDHFTSHNIRLAAKDAGLLTTMKSSDRLVDLFRNRFMFPIHDVDGQLVGYGGRILEKDSESPKYINTPETELFQKSKLLYGLYQNKGEITAKREAMLVEGYMDVVATTSHGLPITVAPMGTALTADQIGLLLNMGVRKLWMCLDGDNAGQKATERNIQVIMEHYHPALDFRLVSLPDNHDPDSYLKAHGLEQMKARMEEAMSLIEYLDSICRKGLPAKLGLEDKACYLSRVEPFLELASGTLQRDLIDRASKVSGLPTELIAQGKYNRAEDRKVSDWHPLVTLAARWVLHDESAKPAQGVAKLTSSSNGLDQLRDLAEVRLTGSISENCEALLAFANAHGPLSDQEMMQLSGSWSAWRRQMTIEESLNTLKSQPFDSIAKKAIKHAMGL